MNKIDEAKMSPSGVECEMDVFHVPNALFQERLAFLGSKLEMDHYAKMCHALALCLRGNVGSKVLGDNVFLEKNEEKNELKHKFESSCNHAMESDWIHCQ